MKTLLDNKFAPITFTCGFVGSSFDKVSEAFVSWQKELDTKFRTQTEITRFVVPLPQALSRLEPLTTPSDRYLLVETRSNWTAIFSNGLRVNDVSSPVAYLPSVLNCRGLEVTCVPDRSEMAGKGGLQIYGCVAFAIWGPSLNLIRRVRVMNDVGGWEFTAEGETQPYEQVETYGTRRVADRLTAEMVASYCQELGVQLLDASFYGGQNLLAHRIKRLGSADPTMSIDEARSCLHL